MSETNIYKDDIKKRDFVLDGKVGEESVRKIAEEIISINRYNEKKISENDKNLLRPINIIINSFGGSIYDANMLIGVIETSNTPVHTYCYGKAMSAGFYIFASGHKRFATPLATFMYHDGSVGLHDTVHGLNYQLKTQTEIRDRYNDYIASVTNIPLEMMREKNRIKEDWYMTAQEAYDYGLVDELILFNKRNK